MGFDERASNKSLGGPDQLHGFDDQPFGVDRQAYGAVDQQYGYKNKHPTGQKHPKSYFFDVLI